MRVDTVLLRSFTLGVFSQQIFEIQPHQILKRV